MFLYFAILDDETENTSKWKESFLATLSRRSASLMQRVYQPSPKLGSVASEENDDEANSSDDEFFVPKGQKKVPVCCLHGL